MRQTHDEIVVVHAFLTNTIPPRDQKPSTGWMHLRSVFTFIHICMFSAGQRTPSRGKAFYAMANAGKTEKFIVRMSVDERGSLHSPFLCDNLEQPQTRSG